jgi:hypothetical protein
MRYVMLMATACGTKGPQDNAGGITALSPMSPLMVSILTVLPLRRAKCSPCAETRTGRRRRFDGRRMMEECSSYKAVVYTLEQLNTGAVVKLYLS